MLPQLYNSATVTSSLILFPFRLDSFLGGGLVTGEIVEIFGASAVGKTQVSCPLMSLLIS